MMRKCIRFLYYLPNYLFARLLFRFMYDKKYLKSKYFKGDFTTVTAIAWRWVSRDFFGRVFLKSNKRVRFPVSPFIVVQGYKNIVFDIDDLIVFQNIGNYFQTFGDGKIYIGKGSWIASNVGLITTNHDIYNLDTHTKSKDIILGKKCWIGMNAIILPGVTLGPHTVVGAGSIVTKSFLEGYCIIAGNPARIIRKI